MHLCTYIFCEVLTQQAMQTDTAANSSLHPKCWREGDWLAAPVLLEYGSLWLFVSLWQWFYRCVCFGFHRQYLGAQIHQTENQSSSSNEGRPLRRLMSPVSQPKDLKLHSRDFPFPSPFIFFCTDSLSRTTTQSDFSHQRAPSAERPPPRANKHQRCATHSNPEGHRHALEFPVYFRRHTCIHSHFTSIQC